MQQHHELFTTLTSFGLLFKQSYDYASFRINEKPYIKLNIKWELLSLPFKTIFFLLKLQPIMGLYFAAL
jgi:hypothetical protein